MKARLILLTVLGILITAALPAAPRQLTRYPLTLVDDSGNTVVLAAAPTRIVSQTLATDEILLSLVDTSRIVAVTTFAVDDQISNVADLAAAVPHKLTQNVETIISLRPDLVVVANWSDPGPVRQMRDAGLPVYLIASGVSVPSIEEKIQRLALMTDEQDTGRQITAAMEKRLGAVSEKISRISPEKRARVMDYATWGSAQGRGSSWDEIVSRAGLMNAVAGLAPDEWGQVPLSKEKVLQINPDLLVLPGWVYGDPGGASAFLTRFTQDPAFRGLAAVKNDKVLMMPEKLKSATSQYIASAVEWLARKAYPELFR
ncbi:MAG TPA: ABC transporter substrate-binding protein [Spirochaetia bacterium]|nr:ABC transporter substrate-binding protein [Spirochaetia bacterium]